MKRAILYVILIACVISAVILYEIKPHKRSVWQTSFPETDTTIDFQPSDWKTYSNSKYHYSFNYLERFKPQTPALGEEITESYDVYASIGVSIHDPEYPSNYSTSTAQEIKISKLSLKEFVDYIWNQSDHGDAEPTLTTFLGQSAYVFTLNGTYRDERESYPAMGSNFVIFEYNKKKYVIHYNPDRKDSMEAFKSFKLID